ncbi:hypothetical protein [Amycolatopsis sp. NPDC058986]|uniref:hypothetical protein n=1 Tax=unclassified Amycolatopsis TaxID=2618356 RepID=UPI00366CEF95
MRWLAGTDLAGHGVELARSWWGSAGRVADQRWSTALASAGERAAITARDPAALAELLVLSARHAEQAEDLPRAEAQWVRALKIQRDRGDAHGAVAVLEALGSLYTRWARLHRAMDAYLDLLAVYEKTQDGHGVLMTSQRLGAVLMLAERPAAAVEYLSRADLYAADDDRIDDSAHAELLIMLGRAQWGAGRTGPARRTFSRALARLVDVDDQGAEYVRALLATEEGAVLPVAERGDVADRSPRER